MQTHAKRLVLLAAVIAAAVTVRLIVGEDYFTLENLKAGSERLQGLVRERPVASSAVYVLLYFMVTGLSVPGAAVLTLAGGFLFGVVRGALMVNIGATAGATGAFLLARYLLGGWVQERYAERLKRFNDDIARSGYNYLLTLRLIPVFPFFLINIFAGLTRIPLFTFVWTTSLGILPGSLVYTFAGRQLTAIGSAGDIVGTRILLALLVLALFTLFPAVYRRLKAR